MVDKVIEIDVSITDGFVYKPRGFYTEDTPFGCKLKINLRGLESHPELSPAVKVKYIQTK